MKPVVRALWGPTVLLVLFVTAAIYEQEIVVRLGVETLEQIRRIFPYVVYIGVWLSLAYLTNRLIGATVWDPLHRRVPVPRLVRDVTAALIYALAITGIVGVVFDKPIGPFWAASGAMGVVLGFALRNVIVDIFMGLAMNFDRPFEIGDFIQVANGPSGRVVEINWRTTRLVTGEGNLVIVSNGKLSELVVTNYSRPEPVSEFEILVVLDSDIPTDRALRVLNAAVGGLAGSGGILAEPAPKARIRGVVAQGIEYKIKYHLDPRVAGPGKARHFVWKAVLDQLHRAGLNLATPKQDVYHTEMPQRNFDVRSLEDRVRLLERVELFQGLTEDERVTLATRMQERFFREHDVIIRRGEAGDSMFILFEGLVHVMLSLQPGQPETKVASLQGGAFFGEMSALTGEARSATVKAGTDTVAFELGKLDIGMLVERRPEVARVIGEAVALRRLRNNEAAARAATGGTPAETKSFALQLVRKMLAFFGVKPKEPAGVA